MFYVVVAVVVVVVAVVAAAVVVVVATTGCFKQDSDRWFQCYRRWTSATVGAAFRCCEIPLFVDVVVLVLVLWIMRQIVHKFLLMTRIQPILVVVLMLFL